MNNGKSFPWNLDLTGVCDQCNRSRAHGNHQKCSKARQAANAKRRAEEAQAGATPAPRKSASLFWLLRQQ
jgi:methionyl-tRNA synthetase